MTEDETRRSSRRADGREPLLVYLDPDLIIRLKKLALDRRTHAYFLVEEAVKDFMGASKDVAEK